MLILEDFWRGNICPGEAKMRPHEEYALCYKRMGKCEDALNAALSPEGKKAWEDYMDAVSAFLQTANIMADGVFQDLLWLCDIGFFLVPTFKKPQCLLIADHGFRTELSASAIVHILVNPVIEVSF